MATSGSTDFTLTSRGVVAAALELTGAVQVGETPSAEDAALGLKHLNLMFKTWSTDPALFIVAEGFVTPMVLSQAGYTVPNARRVTEVRRRVGGIDTPLEMLSRQDYYEIQNKASSGSATSAYFDPQRATRTLYIWPVPAAYEVANATLRYTYHRVIEDCDALDNDPDVPQEWLEAITYSLAARLSIIPGYGGDNAPLINERAASLYAQLQADSEEDASVFLQPA